jgi:hypothetical protein
MDFRLSKKIVLSEGDKIKVSGGPYYLSDSGNKIRMGQKGIGVFKYADEKGDAIFVQFDSLSSPRYVYIGEEKVSEKTGVILKPHKISKIRK